jgi:hypothetical protein
MPNVFDPYREALVVENNTIWPDDYEDSPTAGGSSRCCTPSRRTRPNSTTCGSIRDSPA